jgi:hypothetical protein
MLRDFLRDHHMYMLFQRCTDDFTIFHKPELLLNPMLNEVIKRTTKVYQR